MTVDETKISCDHAQTTVFAILLIGKIYFLTLNIAMKHQSPSRALISHLLRVQRAYGR